MPFSFLFVCYFAVLTQNSAESNGFCFCCTASTVKWEKHNFDLGLHWYPTRFYTFSRAAANPNPQTLSYSVTSFTIIYSATMQPTIPLFRSPQCIIVIKHYFSVIVVRIALASIHFSVLLFRGASLNKSCIFLIYARPLLDCQKTPEKAPI